MPVPEHSIVSGVGHRPLPAVLRGLRQIKHLSRRHIVKVKIRIDASTFRHGAVKLDHGIAQKHWLVEFLAAMRVKFDKEPVGTSRNLHVSFEP